ncbi:hypothetical protein J6X90_03445 [Candidatus Saccharibacteria bacterium]|nr:hypothetical protein [Candidatus Saccharibacteria bacterium]
MRQSDIFSIIIIASVGTMASYFAVNALLPNPDLAHAEIKTIDPISIELAEPDPEIFNPTAINPTVEVFVGECEDIDQNGILSREELINCGKIVEDREENENEQVFTCPDGTQVTDMNYCPSVEDEQY